MVEKAQRTRVDRGAARDTERTCSEDPIEWEVFVRDDTSDPVRHVGSVTATNVERAREHSARLFAWYADDLWLCPADDLVRYSTHSLEHTAGEDDASSEQATATSNDEQVTTEERLERGQDRSTDFDDEPRIGEL